MKRKLIVLAIIAICTFVTSQAQVKIDFNKPPWETGCDSLNTQMEMNICTGEKSALADSVLRLCYETLINYIDDKYKVELQQAAENPDPIFQASAEQVKQQKESVVKSLDDFDRFCSSTVDIIDLQYSGGTMRPMMANIYKLELTVNQIKILLNLMQEIMH